MVPMGYWICCFGCCNRVTGRESRRSRGDRDGETGRFFSTGHDTKRRFMVPERILFSSLFSSLAPCFVAFEGNDLSKM